MFQPIAAVLFATKSFAIELPDPFFTDGTEYQGAIYSKHDALRLTFYHESGIASVPIAGLPTALKDALGYSAEAAAQQQKSEHESREAAAAQAQAQAAKKEVLYGKLIRNTDRGWVVETRKRTGEKRTVSRWLPSLNRYEVHEEDIYLTVYYMVYANPNAVHLKPGEEVTWEILPKEVIHLEGEPMMLAQFLRRL